MTSPDILPLREELSLMPAACLADGQPGWTLHDPNCNRFFQLDWASFEMLSRWHLGSRAAILADINTSTTLQITAEDIDEFIQFLNAHQLLQIPTGSSRLLAMRLKQSKGGLWKWLLHNYLFFRIPLFKPDRWLGKHIWRMEFFFSRSFLWLTVMAGGLGLLNILRAWDEFSTALTDLISWNGVLAYAVTVCLVKIAHELGHGFTAKRFGCRVPTMGIAFLVLWPVAYTDTNDVWKLAKRDQRLKVAAAGIATEIAIAAWASLFWAYLPEGNLKSAVFLLASTTWVSSLLINASPFMRFDGYFLLADFLQIANLHERSFALARWDLRRRLFSSRLAPPEQFSPSRQRFLIIFAWVTWAYRLTIFLGIAMLVYHFFIKALGVILFCVEIGWFVLRPLWSEICVWSKNWPEFRQSRRTRFSIMLTISGCLLLLVPWPTRIATEGLLQAAEQWPIYAPENAQLKTLPFHNGATIKAGETVLTMQSPALVSRTEQGEARQARLTWQSEASGLDTSMRKNWQIFHEQMHAAQAEMGTISAEASRYAPVAPYDGILVDIQPDIKIGDWLSRGELIGRLIRQGDLRVIAYITDEDIHRIRTGDKALFIADGKEGPTARLEISDIDQDASRTLSEAELANLFGGNIAVREKNSTLYPEHAVYRVQFNVMATDTNIAKEHTWRGHVVIAGRWETPLLALLRSGMGVFWREAGF